MPTILVATDFSPTAALAVQEAIALAKAIGAEIELLHVHQVDATPIPPTLDIVTEIPRAEDVARAEQSLVEQSHVVRDAGVVCRTQSAFGAPAQEIVARAKAVAARYLVVGRHGHRPLTEVLLGSVSTRIVRHAPCPLLLVPSSSTT